MQRVGSGGVARALELWDVPLAGLASILQNEPPGLAIGKVVLKDGRSCSACSANPCSAKGSARSRLRRLARIHRSAQSSWS
jgi:hypothetical protein